ncbi:hypothetical protein GCM10012286_29710 [Streptomyces lasiicapitis]|uniref:Uncharacterized protein n=1 Tax=Streptomyces lasiicapitis TaxID=1923961 RepID=A0ABQ2LWX4_9ACTN|nr:hypothetical protein GCM10012286_29710 [Streptomyces lasiicapitis]
MGRHFAVPEGDEARYAVGDLDTVAAFAVAVAALAPTGGAHEVVRDFDAGFPAAAAAVAALAPAGIAQVELTHRLWSFAADSSRVRVAFGDFAAALMRS